jgi:hypothetical protein
MFNKFIIPVVFSIVSMGCSHSAQQQTVSSPAVASTVSPPASSSLPQLPVPNSSWQMVSEDNWSFKLPSEFEAVSIPEEAQTTIRAAYMTPNKKAMVAFATEKTNLTLDDYTSSFVKSVIDGGDKLIQARSGHIGNKEATMVLAELTQQSSALFGFFIVDSGEAYGLTCVLNGSVFEEKMPVCFAVAKTITIK